MNAFDSSVMLSENVFLLEWLIIRNIHKSVKVNVNYIYLILCHNFFRMETKKWKWKKKMVGLCWCEKRSIVCGLDGWGDLIVFLMTSLITTQCFLSNVYSVSHSVPFFLCPFFSLSLSNHTVDEKYGKATNNYERRLTTMVRNETFIFILFIFCWRRLSKIISKIGKIVYKGYFSPIISNNVWMHLIRRWCYPKMSFFWNDWSLGTFIKV